MCDDREQSGVRGIGAPERDRKYRKHCCCPATPPPNVTGRLSLPHGRRHQCSFVASIAQGAGGQRRTPEATSGSRVQRDGRLLAWLLADGPAVWSSSRALYAIHVLRSVDAVVLVYRIHPSGLVDGPCRAHRVACR